MEKLNDECVKLKTLQTALTLMQSPVLAQSEVGSACLFNPVRLLPFHVPKMRQDHLTYVASDVT